MSDRTRVFRLLRIATRLTDPEKHVLKGLIVRRDPRLIQLTSDDEMLLVVSTIVVSNAFHVWYDLFRAIDCSAHTAWHLHQNSDCSRTLMTNPDPFSSSLLYGEVDFFGFASLLAMLAPQPDQCLYDLGHGSGRAVFAAALLYPTLHLVGIELVDALFDASRMALHEFQTRTRPTAGTITLIHGDLTQVDWWSHAGIVFVNATAFSAPLWADVETLLPRLRPTARFVSLTQTTAVMTLVAQCSVATSWGTEPAYIYQGFPTHAMETKYVPTHTFESI
ncbi:Aste57867_17014 [Aphanomyces stellatus]|uniref:Histone-lysine N-methyltransferase, H3 lysine-79 specific n=1 Tax=Aphanomyces stellatus TaxID=120398 RepID=A0A485L744_9STRA|nr:hypothetical protein As57867_016956 [Aphanomyces stellatus]VFT93775.1 Aste57867_17014 [Aphanomyces stellatus]